MWRSRGKRRTTKFDAESCSPFSQDDAAPQPVAGRIGGASLSATGGKAPTGMVAASGDYFRHDLRRIGDGARVGLLLWRSWIDRSASQPPDGIARKSPQSCKWPLRDPQDHGSGAV